MLLIYLQTLDYIGINCRTNTLAYLHVGYGEKSYTTFIFALDAIKLFLFFTDGDHT
jgi:hypothetical protein